MRIVSDLKSKKEFNEMKSVMEIFVVNTRIKQIAVNA
jgi:hypothetical protein